MGVYNTSFINPYALFAQQFKEVSINRLLEFRLTKTSPMHEDKHRTCWNKPYVQGKRFYICTAKGEGRMTTTKRRIDAKNAEGQISLPDTVVTSLAIPERNPGMSLDMDWVSKVHINRSAVERRAATMNTRRTVKKEWQAAWLLRAITCIDLTTLAGDDTPGNVLRLCAKARQPVRQDLLEALGASSMELKVGAVCVYHNLVPVAVEALRGTDIPVAAVSTGFPAGQNPMEQKLGEIEASVKAGAGEIDIVISRAHVLTGNWQALYDEVRAFRAACGDAHMKTILATHELATLRNVGMASLVCMMAGADFIKTSTGKEPVNATLPVGVVMVRAIRDYYEQTGYQVGFKPAGGIRSAKESLDWLILMKEELGNAWLNNTLFRIGASGLLSDIERQLSYFVTGHYAAAHHNPMV
jgi:deoxyribose-phosphate aldolase